MQKWLESRGVKVFYRDLGEGKPVVLVHGFGEDGDVWDQQVESLRNNFRLLIPDLPGSGSSEVPAKAWLLEDHAQMLKELLEAETVDEAAMIGHSMGGYITMAFTEKFSSSLKGFGLVHSTSYADNDEKKATRRKGIEFMRQHGATAFLDTIIPNLFSANSREKNPDLVKKLQDKSSNFTVKALVSYYEAMIRRPDRRNVLEETNLPVLFIAGEHDGVIPAKDVLEQSHLPQKSYIHVLRESGHMGMWEEPANTNLILDEFLNRIWLD